MRDTRVWELLSCVTLVLSLQGCAVFTTYQSARVLPSGHVAPALEVGGGATSSGYPLMIDLGPAVRVGVGKDFDIGLRPTLLYADVKYQFMKGPRCGAVDLGVSYFPPTDAGFDSPDVVQDVGIYPMVLYSGPHYFYGVRVAYIRQVRQRKVTDFLMPGVVLGLSIGRRFRFLPAIGIYYSPVSGVRGNPPVAGGLGFGLEYEFGRSAPGQQP